MCDEIEIYHFEDPAFGPPWEARIGNFFGMGDSRLGALEDLYRMLDRFLTAALASTRRAIDAERQTPDPNPFPKFHLFRLRRNRRLMRKG